VELPRKGTAWNGLPYTILW